MNHAAELIDRYIAIWNETDASHRRELIALTWMPDARYRDPLMQSEGHAGIDAMVQAVQERFPGHRFHRVGEVDALHDHLRFSWSLAPDGAEPVARGTDFAAVSEDGRLRTVTGYLDAGRADAANGRTAAAAPVWSIDGFAAFWARPDARHVPRAVTTDVVGWWPGSTEPVRGVAAYTQRIADLLAMVPDFRLEVAEHAASGDFTFVRWIARGTADSGPFEFSGVDRVRTRGGLVCENMIFADHPLLHALAAHSAAGATDAAAMMAQGPEHGARTATRFSTTAKEPS